MEKKFREIFNEWSETTQATEEEKELAQDFCSFLDLQLDKSFNQITKGLSSDNSPEEIFEENANEMMCQFNLEKFKRDYKTLYKVIIKSIKDYESF